MATYKGMLNAPTSFDERFHYGTVEDRRNEQWPTMHFPGSMFDAAEEVATLPQTVTRTTRPDYHLYEADPTPIANQLGLQEILEMERFQNALGPQQEVSGAVRAGGSPELPPANIPPPEPQGWNAPLPQISMEGFGRPNIGVSLPTNSGFSMEGKFTRPEEWDAMLRYKRQF